MNDGIKQTANHRPGAPNTGSQSTGRRSNTRAACQQHAMAEISATLPMPMDRMLAAKPRVANSSAATQARKNVTLHQAYQVALRCLYQNTKNRPPSTALMKSPNTRTVKESICMSAGAPDSISDR